MKNLQNVILSFVLFASILATNTQALACGDCDSGYSYDYGYYDDYSYDYGYYDDYSYDYGYYDDYSYDYGYDDYSYDYGYYDDYSYDYGYYDDYSYDYGYYDDYSYDYGYYDNDWYSYEEQSCAEVTPVPVQTPVVQTPAVVAPVVVTPVVVTPVVVTPAVVAPVVVTPVVVTPVVVTPIIVTPVPVQTPVVVTPVPVQTPVIVEKVIVSSDEDCGCEDANLPVATTDTQSGDYYAYQQGAEGCQAELDRWSSSKQMKQYIPEGATIRVEGGIDVYIVKYMNGKMFKRLVLSPSVFENYGHLRWEDVMNVSPDVLDAYTTSDFVTSEETGKVYRLYPSGDTGTKRLVEVGGCVWNQIDQDSIYLINGFDERSYTTASVLE